MIHLIYQLSSIIKYLGYHNFLYDIILCLKCPCVESSVPKCYITEDGISANLTGIASVMGNNSGLRTTPCGTPTENIGESVKLWEEN